MSGAVATALTFVKNFRMPCIYIALASGVLCGGTGFWLGMQVQKVHTKVAEISLVERQRDEAERDSLRKTRDLSRAADELKLHDTINQRHTDDTLTLNRIAADVRNIRSAVGSLCDKTSTFTTGGVQVGSAGVDAGASADGRARPAVEVLQELDNEHAKRADDYGYGLNAWYDLAIAHGATIAPPKPSK